MNKHGSLVFPEHGTCGPGPDEGHQDPLVFWPRNLQDVVTTTDHVLSYIFTSGSTGTKPSATSCRVPSTHQLVQLVKEFVSSIRQDFGAVTCVPSDG